MKIRFLLVLSAWLCSTMVQAKDFVWYNGKPIVYSLQRNTSVVVETAARLFENDMQDVTGQRARQGSNSIIQLYQLDHITDDELNQLTKWRVPYMQIITHPDAFWIGVRGKQIVIVGSNGRGAAYGLMDLSRQAGVSPFKEWAGLLPQQRKRLTIDDAQERVEIPSIAYRGVCYPGGDLQTFACLLLRLKGNLISGTDDKELTDAFGFLIEGQQDMATKQKGNKKNRKKQEGHGDLDWNFLPRIDRHDDGYGYLMPTVQQTKAEKPQKNHGHTHKKTQESHGLLYHTDGVQPGLMTRELHRAWDGQTRDTWMAQSNDPALSALQLNLFMDMAWNINGTASDQADRYLNRWLQEQFGRQTGARLVSPMARYYRLSAQWPQKPWEMTAQKDTPFNADELGNELDRYLNECRDTWHSIQERGHDIEPTQAAGFGQLIEYPAAFLYEMAEMTLQAQEARHIGRKESFHHDTDALESAARSVLAYEAILNFPSQWPAADPAGRLAKMAAPLLPDTLSRTEISRYGQAIPFTAKLTTDGSIVYNAARYNKATAAQPIPLLGHSMKAVDLQVGGSLEYRFYAREGDVLLHIALIPTLPDNGTMQRITVKVDGGQPLLISLNDDTSPQQRAQDVARGQAVRTLELRLTGGNHTLTIAALDPNVIIDQWMIDYDRDRIFYLFPTKGETDRPQSLATFHSCTGALTGRPSKEL